jgi:hypothetical protein
MRHCRRQRRKQPNDVRETPEHPELLKRLAWRGTYYPKSSRMAEASAQFLEENRSPSPALLVHEDFVLMTAR